MKKILYFLLLTIFLSGCATANFVKNIHIGMTKEQVLASCDPCKSPMAWNRQEINGKIYESLNYNPFLGNFDFVDGILIGYSRRDPFGNLKYYSKDDQPITPYNK